MHLAESRVIGIRPQVKQVDLLIMSFYLLSYKIFGDTTSMNGIDNNHKDSFKYNFYLAMLCEVS